MAPFCATRVFVVLLFVASCVQFGKAVSCGITNDITKDTTFVMRKCNSNIRNYYDKNAGQNWRTTYCRGMIILMKCASNRTEMFEDKHKCTSETLQEWVFVALQYIVISKKLGICDYNTTKLRNLVRKLGFENDPLYKDKSIVYLKIPDSAARRCSRWIHWHCAKNLTQEANLCNGVSEFVSCYDKKVSTFPHLTGYCAGQAKAPEITLKFNALIQQFSTDLISKYKYSINQEDMCQVDETVLDPESEIYP